MTASAKNLIRQNSAILVALERLAASYPWDDVDIWISRAPEGKMHFTAYVKDNDKLGTGSCWGHGDTVEDAVDHLIKSYSPDLRNPEVARDRKIKELEEKLEKLRAVQIGLPPYVPNRELAQFCQSSTVDV